MTDLDVLVTAPNFPLCLHVPYPSMLLSRCGKARMRWASMCRPYATVSRNPIDGPEISASAEVDPSQKDTVRAAQEHVYPSKVVVQHILLSHFLAALLA
jgi:hypothetical protein